MKNENNFPLVSYIIPTYNAEKYLRQCLDSIFMQDYPNSKYEVLIADGGSTDATREILKEYDVKVFENPERDCDDGKFLALEKAKGEIIALVDADNILVGKNWLKNMIKPLQEEKEIMGVESNFFIAKDFSSINSYANLLIIVDPLARILASNPDSISFKKGYYIKRFKQRDVPISGANGFLWRKSVIDKYLDKNKRKFAEGNLLSLISCQQEVCYANVNSEGIYHYYCVSFLDYIKKRMKIARKFLARKSRKESTWVDRRRGIYFVFSVLYLISLILPLFEGIICAFKYRKIAWMWHPIVCFATIFIYISSFIFYKFKSFKNGAVIFSGQ